MDGAEERDREFGEKSKPENQEQGEEDVLQDERVRAASAIAEKAQIVTHISEQLVMIGLILRHKRFGPSAQIGSQRAESIRCAS